MGTAPVTRIASGGSASLADVGELPIEVIERGLELRTAAGVRGVVQFAFDTGNIELDQLTAGSLFDLFGSEYSLFHAQCRFGRLRLLGLDFFAFPTTSHRDP